MPSKKQWAMILGVSVIISFSQMTSLAAMLGAFVAVFAISLGLTLGYNGKGVIEWFREIT